MNVIVNSEKGQQALKDVYAEADGCKEGVGRQLKDMWEKDYMDWQH